MRNARRWLLASLAPALLLAAGPASAAEEEGRIDHVVSEGGVVQVLYSLPGLTSVESADLDSVAVTVAGQPVKATAEPVESSDQVVRRTSILAIDVSRSMAGEKFTAAKEAALAFVDTAPIDVYIGLVTFASDVETVTEPSRDRDALRKAIEGLSLTKQTRLYDGVLQAISVAGKEGVRSILLLSDGKDTSQTELDKVTARLSDDELRVDVVALDQSVTADSPLQKIAVASGGDVSSIDAAELEALFQAQAAELSTQLVITFPHPAAVDGDAELDVAVAAGEDTYVDEALVALPASVAPPPDTPRVTSEPSSGMVIPRPWLVAGVAMLFLGFAALLAVGLSNAGRAEMTPMQRQLQLYTVHGMDTHKARRGGSQPGADVPGIKESAVAFADRFVKGQDFEAKLAKKLDRAGFKLTASEWILLHIAIIVVAPLIGLLATGGNVAVVLLFLILGAALPWLYLSLKESRRIKKFNAELAQTLQIIAGALQAGLSLPQAVDTVVQEGAEPIADEFRRAIIEQRLGVDIEDTLDTVADRMDSQDFKWVVMAVRIQREVGGNLAELLLTVSATLREREYLRRQVQVLSAEGRLSAWILGGLPVFFFGYLALLRPEYIEPMLTNPMGWAMLGAAVVMMIVGSFWLKQTVKVEV